jgi:hypothetical protein
MNVGAILALLFGSAGSGSPSTPPNVVKGTLGYYSGGRISLTWTPGGAYPTRIYYPNESTLHTTISAGTTYWESGIVGDGTKSFGLKHVNGGVESESFLTLAES